MSPRLELTTSRLTLIPFRGLSFWLPMLPGIWFSRGEMTGMHKHEPVGQPA